jgi:ubiquinone/menaquinone biosynthesis C-methylase UbiE
MRPEYDLSEGVRGKHHEAYRAGTNVVFLDPDIAEVFTDSAAVKQVLRQLVKLARTHVSMKSRRRSEEFVSAFAAETRALAALNMDIDLRRRMLDYYNERAPEYEEAYTLGTGTASIPDPEVFRTEATSLSGIVRTFARGHLIDLACGTAYWLPHYADSCVQITLFDQSEKMLEESRTKVADRGIADRCIVLQGDFFEYEFGRQAYDCALVGFFLSHLTEPQESLLFGALRHMLQSSGRFLILDSAWSTSRCGTRSATERRFYYEGDAPGGSPGRHGRGCHFLWCASAVVRHGQSVCWHMGR